MAKKASVIIVIFAIFLGGIAVWLKTRPVEEPTTVLGDTIKLQKTETKPKETFIDSTPVTPTTTPVPTIISQKGPATMEIDTKKAYDAVLKTNLGDITVALNASATPITVNNFVTLARKNFYDSTIFHRIIKGFMIQGGDPNGTGTGGPGYQFDDEPFIGEYTKGTIAMANAGPNTNGSQFFIMHADYPLPKNYVIFGHVTSGMEVVDKIATAATKPGGEGSTPVNPTIVSTIEIIEK
ncbi:MAG: peptidylprolyl isomerase [Microgenomates group bacterium]